MTNQGISYILELIKNHIIEPPLDLDLDQLSHWLLGYNKAVQDMAELLNNLSDER